MLLQIVSVPAWLSTHGSILHQVLHDGQMITWSAADPAQASDGPLQGQSRLESLHLLYDAILHVASAHARCSLQLGLTLVRYTPNGLHAAW